MSDDSVRRPGRRFLHLCYCCADADAVAAFFAEGLGLKIVMKTAPEPSDGELLGMDGDIVAWAVFVYDYRGGRVSPSIEIHGWVDPEVTGTPSVDPFEAGLKALGFAVPDLEAAVAKLLALGCTEFASGVSPFGATVRTLLDPLGTPIELVEEAGIPEGRSRMRHLRVTCTDLATSLPFYDALGFDVIDQGTFSDAGYLGVELPIDARYARLRLPDEPYEVHLVQGVAPATHGRHYAEPYHLGIYRAAMGVDDTRASYDALTADGLVFDRVARVVELKGTPVPDMWITFISDPDGIPYEFVQRPRSAFA